MKIKNQYEYQFPAYALCALFYGDLDGLDDELGNRLTEACEGFGECWIYVNDDQTLSI